MLSSLTLISGSAIADPPANQSDTQIPVLEINGAIGPALSDYLIREIARANEVTKPPLIMLVMDTPGGLSSSLRDINQRILNSTIPIACLVYPSGARAASAGTYILYACHIAAMAPATTLGAATPVKISMTGDKDGKEDKPKSDAMEQKVLNDAIAYIRALAQLRGRNAQWAELAVKEAATLTAEEALEKQVIDMLAASPQELLKHLEGYKVKIGEQQLQLHLAQTRLDYRQPDWRNRFIGTITNPNIAYILMLIGVYGLLLEFYSPGIGVAGIAGAIALLIALYAFQMLPLNYAGLGLLLLGIGLLVVESLQPSFGIFGFGGIVAFIIGSVFLIDTEQPELKLDPLLIAGVATVSGIFVLVILGYLWRAQGNRIVSGQEAIIGAYAIVEHDFDGHGFVELAGERWAAVSQQPLKQGESVVVVQIDGLTLRVAAEQPKETYDGSHL
ncbi:nodulation protein NfeD [Shewanella sp. CG12_big_fil_rev_8_21_14_0_65_47_15]|uniref:NfeD family protein n=1 Tax=Shewanella sp. CG12_big_fil_rev_8_21_14_0_65_47_15 TaxID=1975537 RepID=UPI000CBEF9F3|nr:nodulation protein NfeD [Shewanella sp. CG12_big_fil_rev_8_21_14_0_65_47_15]PIW62046.1 MAG: serine protease [Shewanella sp. CG12_big_fil_rev_8_21_14_0_65_47_15]